LISGTHVDNTLRERDLDARLPELLEDRASGISLDPRFCGAGHLADLPVHVTAPRSQGI